MAGGVWHLSPRPSPAPQYEAPGADWTPGMSWGWGHKQIPEFLTEGAAAESQGLESEA